MTHADDCHVILREGRTDRLLARRPIAVYGRSISACATTSLLPIPWCARECCTTQRALRWLHHRLRIHSMAAGRQSFVRAASMTCNTDCAQVIRREPRASVCVCTPEMTGREARMHVQATCVDRGQEPDSEHKSGSGQLLPGHQTRQAGGEVLGECAMGAVQAL